MKLNELFEQTEAYPLRFTIEATVPSGFESVAKDECQKAFSFRSDFHIVRARGRIFFNVHLLEMDIVYSLRSIDKINIITCCIQKANFMNEKETDINLIKNSVKYADWNKALKIWALEFHYRGVTTAHSNSFDHALKQEYELRNLVKFIVEHKVDCHLAESILLKTGPINFSNVEKQLQSNLDCITVQSIDNPSQPKVLETCCDLSRETIIVEDKVTHTNTNSNPDILDTNVSQSTHSSDLVKQVNISRSVINSNKMNIKKAIENELYKKFDRREECEKVLKYRVTCNRSGNHSFASQEAAHHFGGVLQDMFCWVVDLSLYDMEVILNIAQDELYGGVSLTKESRHHRNVSHFGPTTLRATVCYCLLHIAAPQPGDIVLDALCGGGSIPIEGLQAFRGTYQICGDIHPKAVARARSNLEDLGSETVSHTRNVIPSLELSCTMTKNMVEVLAWDATNLPLRSACIDVVILDLPFGKRCGTTTDNRTLYFKVLCELARVTKIGSRVVILTHDCNSFKKAFMKVHTSWAMEKILSANIGGLRAHVYHFVRVLQKETNPKTTIKHIFGYAYVPRPSADAL